MNENQEYMERERRRSAEGEVRLERLKVDANTYSILLGRAGDYLEQAYLTYMEGSMLEDWKSFESWMRSAIVEFKSCTEALYRIAEIAPSSVEPERYKELESLVNVTNDLLLRYYQGWAKRLKEEDYEAIPDHWTCASLLVAGIYKGDMESKAGEAYCDSQCKYRRVCDGEGL